MFTVTKREKKYFNAARSMALCSNHKDAHIGCIIISSHQIIAAGFNHMKSHPQQKRLNRYRFNTCDESKDFIHAELSTILKVKNTEDLKGAIIYVYREDKNHQIAISRPCQACMKKIKEVGIKTIYYTTREGFCREDLK